jgi:hypothetical protein
MSAEPRTRPLIAVLYHVPLFVEALDGVFDGLAEVRPVPVDESAEALVRWLRPDAVVVDEGPVAFALAYGDEADVPVVHVSLREPEVRTWRDGRWAVDAEDTAPEAIRDVVVAGLIGARS